MIENINDELVFRFPEIEATLHSEITAWLDRRIAQASPIEIDKIGIREKFLSGLLERHGKVQACVSFQRTLRIPDDGKEYPLPPGLGNLPLRHIEDFVSTPTSWRATGGVMLPMHRGEAMWLRFSGRGYPMILRVASGKVCAVSGLKWESGLSDNPQNYVVIHDQPWLDGFRIGKDLIRQFVAVPIGKGLTVESQISGREGWGGIQLQAYPLKAEVFLEVIHWVLEADWERSVDPLSRQTYGPCFVRSISAAGNMGLGAGGKIRQRIYRDSRDITEWDTSISSRCFVRLCLADDWQRLTGTPCPHEPPTAEAYTNAGLPWFDYENPVAVLAGQTALSGVNSVDHLLKDKTGFGIPDNAPLESTNVIKLKRSTPQVVSEF